MEKATIVRTLPIVDIRTIGPGRRLGAWQDKLNEFYYPLDVEGLGPDFSFGMLSSIDIGGVRVGSVDSDPMLIHRNSSHVSRKSGDFYLLPMPVNAPLRLYQRGREALVAPSDLAMVGTADIYTYEQRTRTASTTLRIPGSLLRSRIADIDDWTARSFPAQHAAVSLFLDFADSFRRNVAKLEPEIAISMVHHLIDLLAIALSSSEGAGCSEETAVRIAHRQRALRVVENQFRSSALSPARIAQEIGVSDRYLQRLFAEHKQTLSAIIQERRIAEARRILATHSGRSRSISMIAYQVGFADPAYFSRVFREKTGEAPSEYRDAALKGQQGSARAVGSDSQRPD